MSLRAHNAIYTPIITQADRESKCKFRRYGRRSRKSAAGEEYAGFLTILPHIVDHTISMKTSEIWWVGGAGKKLRNSTACGKCIGFCAVLQHIMDPLAL